MRQRIKDAAQAPTNLQGIYVHLRTVAACSSYLVSGLDVVVVVAWVQCVQFEQPSRNSPNVCHVMPSDPPNGG